MKKVLIYIVIVFILVPIGFVALDSILGLNNTQNIKDKVRELINEQTEQESKTDDRPLEINLIEQSIEVYESVASIPLVSNKELNIDSNRLKLLLISQTDGRYEYVLEVANIGLGSSTLSIKFTDSIGQVQSFDLSFNRKNINLPLGKDIVIPWEGFTYLINGDDLLTNVNKANRLTTVYEPDDLVNLNKDYLLITESANITLRQEAAEALANMLASMKTESGQTVSIVSGYRSYNSQIEAYTYNVKLNGQAEADKISARPGFSEHQLGTVVDFFNKDTGYQLSKEFDDVPAGEWLKNNSYKYGFVQTYPEGAENITGYQFEPWHYRYIGIKNAQELKESGLVFQEWVRNR